MCYIEACFAKTDIHNFVIFALRFRHFDDVPRAAFYFLRNRLATSVATRRYFSFKPKRQHHHRRLLIEIQMRCHRSATYQTIRYRTKKTFICLKIKLMQAFF